MKDKKKVVQFIEGSIYTFVVREDMIKFIIQSPDEEGIVHIYHILFN